MAIEVKHGVSPAAVAAAGFGGGQGRSRAAAARGGAAALSREEAQQRALAAQAQQSELSRKFRADESKLAFERGTQRQQQAFDFQQQSADAALLRRVGSENIEDVRKNGELQFGLTSKQKLELDRMAESEAAALASTDYTDDEKAELRRRFAARRAGIQPVARPREQTAAEKFAASTYTDPKTGAVYPITADGTFGKPLYEPPERQPTYKDRIDAVKAASAMATANEGGVFDQALYDKALASMGFGGAGPGAGPGSPAEGVRSLPGTVAGLNESNSLMGGKFTGQQFVGPQSAEELIAGVDIGGRSTSGPADPQAAAVPEAVQKSLHTATQTIQGQLDRLPPIEQLSPEARKLVDASARAGVEADRLNTEIAATERTLGRMRRAAAEGGENRHRFFRQNDLQGGALDFARTRNAEAERADGESAQALEARLAKLSEQRAAANRKAQEMSRKLRMYERGRNGR